MYYYCISILGRRTWNLVEHCGIRFLSCIVHVSTELFHQNFDGEMDFADMHVLLYDLHLYTILSGILHNHSRSNICWNWSCSHVECKVHLSNSGNLIMNCSNFKVYKFNRIYLEY